MTKNESREYMERFVLPVLESARKAGIPESRIREMWADAVEHCTPDMPPGRLFRDAVDREIRQAIIDDVTELLRDHRAKE